MVYFVSTLRKEVTKKEKIKTINAFLSILKKNEICSARFHLQLLSFYFLNIAEAHTFMMRRCLNGKQHVQTAV